LYILLALDLLQDIATIIPMFLLATTDGGHWIPTTFLVISIAMFLGDLYALWLVSMDRPFLFFDSIFLEKYFLGLIMLLDIGYDLV
jgi:hypothetical protein